VDGSREAIVFLARVTARATPASRPPVKPSRTSWSKGNDHVEVNGRDVTAWTDGPFGGDGRSCMLEEFLAGDLHDTVSGIFGRGVLREVWAAARWFAAQKAGRTGGKRKRK
jgi:hypothetical protein